MADDGFGVSILVTTVWARAVVAKGAKVGILTIHTAAAQVAAVASAQVDLVELHNGALLDYLDENSEAAGRAEVDSAIAGKLPAGLGVLTSTAARDDLQLTVSATTAATYRLQSVSDLG
jgi:glycine betaine/choline ABC-type transport system substrate-binding protein